jgi:hypothetical protein
MAFTITGAKYGAAAVISVGTTTVATATAPFVSGDFAKQRLVGLWSSGAVFKGMAWVRRFVSTSQLELERPFFDPATGITATQAVGDQVLVSKDFSESVVAGLAVSGRVVTLTDTCTFGVNGNQLGICLYDENKLVNATVGTLLSGGLVVFGKLDDYATSSVSSSIDWQSSNANPILCNDAAVNFCGYGGRWEAVPAGGGGAYFIGGNNQGTAGNTVVLNGIECPNDLLTNTAGGNWARNPTRHQLINCYSITTSTNAIMRRWGDGIIRGGQYKFPNNTNQPISAFGSDSAGTYTVAANPGDRAVILDMGAGPALVRNNSPAVMTFNFTNLITTDFRSVTGAAGNLPPNPNGTNTFRFSDTYTGLQSGSVGVILNNSGLVASIIASSNGSWSPSLLRRTCVGATVTVNATSWTYGLKKYGFQVVSGTITPATYDLGVAGQADNVAFGGIVNQLADTGVTLTQAQALALSSKFTASSAGDGTLTVTGNATYSDLYDFLIAWNTSSVALAQFPSIAAYPVTFAGSALNTSMSIVINANVTLSEDVKFKSLNTTSTVTNNGTINGTYTDSTGTRVTIKTADNLPLSTYLTIDGVPQAWQVGQTSRNIFVGPASVVRIYAHAYGYQPKIINVTGNTASDYILALLPETNVDTTLNTTTRDTIAAGFAVGVDAQSRLFLSVGFDMRPYTPAQVLNALHYFTVTQGALIAAASTAANSVDGFALIQGGFVLRTPGFYGKVSDTVTEDTDMGIYVPLYVLVDPSVYVTDPTFTPVKKNSSGVVLGVALWTQIQADVPTWVASQYGLQVINDGVKKASLLIPHTTNLS